MPKCDFNRVALVAYIIFRMSVLAFFFLVY